LAARVAEAVFGAGAGSNRRKLELKYDDAESAAKAVRSTRKAMADVAERLAEFESAAARRMLAATQLVQVNALRTQAGLDDDAPTRIAPLRKAARLVSSLCPALVELRNQLAATSSLFACVRENEKSAALISAIQSNMGAIRERLVSIRGRLEGHPY